LLKQSSFTECKEGANQLYTLAHFGLPQRAKDFIK